MKELRGAPFDQWRNRDAELKSYGREGNARNGIFNVPLPSGVVLRVIASDGFGWDHLSVTAPGRERCPTWEEMVYVKRAFFERDEWACELHPPERENISAHPYCLHIWRCQYAAMELPPTATIAPKGTAWQR